MEGRWKVSGRFEPDEVILPRAVVLAAHPLANISVAVGVDVAVERPSGAIRSSPEQTEARGGCMLIALDCT